MSIASKPLIGGHVSTAGGIFKSIENGLNIGADCVQIFGASPRSWAVRLLSKAEVEKFKTAQSRSSIKKAFLHAAYLVNLGTANPDLLKKSVKNLIGHLRIAEQIGAEGLIFHVGSSKGMTKDAALRQEAEAMKEILREAPGKAWLIMENTAGGGEKIGSVEDLARLTKATASPRLKICFDTAHAFEAGLLRYEPAAIKDFFDNWDRLIGAEQIVAVHANDSRTEFASHHDRHDNIGEGKIGLAGFRHLAKEERLRGAAWLLEVPGFKGEGPDAENIKRLRACF